MQRRVCSSLGSEYGGCDKCTEPPPIHIPRCKRLCFATKKRCNRRAISRSKPYCLEHLKDPCDALSNADCKECTQRRVGVNGTTRCRRLCKSTGLQCKRSALAGKYYCYQHRTRRPLRTNDYGILIEETDHLFDGKPEDINEKSEPLLKKTIFGNKSSRYDENDEAVIFPPEPRRIMLKAVRRKPKAKKVKKPKKQDDPNFSWSASESSDDSDSSIEEIIAPKKTLKREPPKKEPEESSSESEYSSIGSQERIRSLGEYSSDSSDSSDSDLPPPPPILNRKTVRFSDNTKPGSRHRLLTPKRSFGRDGFPLMKFHHDTKKASEYARSRSRRIRAECKKEFRDCKGATDASDHAAYQDDLKKHVRAMRCMSLLCGKKNNAVNKYSK